MIPEFPEFKTIELTDKEEIDRITKKFPPYSDFNFVSMWSWDIKGDMRVSRLNGNLVVRFNDYLTGEPFYSFIGHEMAHETAIQLISAAKAVGIAPQLKFIPEEVSSLVLGSLGLSVEEDRDHFDYILDLEELSKMEGGKFKRKRNEINGLLMAHPMIEYRELDLSDIVTKRQVIRLFHDWVASKAKMQKEYEENEEDAFDELLLISETGSLIAAGAFIDGKLIAFMICERVSRDYAIGHSAKADVSVHGANAYMMKCMAEVLLKKGCRYLNYEQDLGLPNLREAKLRFSPVSFLKKYIVTQTI